MKAIQLTGGGTDLPRPAAEPDRGPGATGSRFVRIGAAAGVLFALLALGGAALSGSDALREAGALLNAAAPLLLILWITGAWRLQLRLSAWRGRAARRWQTVAYGLWVGQLPGADGIHRRVCHCGPLAGRPLRDTLGRARQDRRGILRDLDPAVCGRRHAGRRPAGRRHGALGPSARSNRSSTRRPATCW